MDDRRKIMVYVELTDEERALLSDCIISESEVRDALRFLEVKDGKRLCRLSLVNLEFFRDNIAAEANHAPNRRRQKRLDDFCDKLEMLLDEHDIDEPV